MLNYCIKRIWVFSTCTLLLCISCLARDISSLIVFGDSLSDSGNTCNEDDTRSLLCPIYSEIGGGPTFTNGKTWAQHLNHKFKLPRLKPSSQGGLNFAYAGAKSGWNKPKDKRNPLNLGTQIDIFEKQFLNLKKVDLSTSLVALWVGGNDMKNGKSADKLLNNVEKHLEKLIELGATFIMVPNLPSLASIPLFKKGIFKGASSFLGFATNYLTGSKENGIKGVYKGIMDSLLENRILEYNQKLEELLDELELKYSITIYRFDAFTYFTHLQSNPLVYNIISNPEDDLLFGDDFFIFDGLHPNHYVHKAIAQEVFKHLSSL